MRVPPPNDCRSWRARIAAHVAPHVHWRAMALVALVGIAWLSHLEFPTRTDEPGLDSSWREVLGHGLARGWQSGVDLVFTFGPLGYFHAVPYNRDLYWAAIGWEIAFKLALTCAVVLAARRTRSILEMAVFAVVLVLVFPGEDAFYFTSVLAIAMLVIDGRARSGRWTALGLASLALIALVKFTYFAAIVVSVAWIALQRARTVSWKRGVLVLALYASILTLVWTIVGQSPLHLPRYVAASWWIATGYNEGMTWPVPVDQVSTARTMLALAAAAALFHVLQRPRDATAWIRAGMLGSGLFIALKAGFVRGSTVTFFSCAALSIFFLPALEAHSRRERILRGMQALARIACALLGLQAYVGIAGGPNGPLRSLVEHWAQELRAHVETLADLPADRDRLDRYRHAIESFYALPRIREAVGQEPVDVFGSTQSTALLNGLNYHPRPVFQSYSAYTPELMELNAAFYRGERAPKFVLFESDALDGRLPGSEDGLALQVLMRDYEPRLAECGFVLLERVSRTSAVRRLLLDTTIRFGETLDLDRIRELDAATEPERGARGDARTPVCLVLALDIRPSLAGRLRAALLKGSPVYMESTLDSGAEREDRILPGLLRTGVLVSPRVDTQETWVRWYAGERIPQISKLRLSIQRGAEHLFDPEVSVQVFRDDTLVPKLDPELGRKLVYSMFSIAPEYARSNPPPFRSRVRNIEVLRMEVPAEMGFAVAPGKHSVRALFGMALDAFIDHCSDGAEFTLVARDESGSETVLFQRTIDESVVTYRWPQELAVTYESPAPARLLFRIGPGPRGKSACDWGYWSAISITDGATEPSPK